MTHLRSRARLSAAVAGFLACVASLSSCATRPEDSITPSDPALGDAEISLHQQSVIDEFERTGRVTFEDYRQSMDDLVDCVTQLNITVHDYRIEEWGGQPHVVMHFSGDPFDDPQAQEAEGARVSRGVDACTATYPGAVSALYERNPEAVAFRDELRATVVREYGRTVVDCLMNEGIHGIDPLDHDAWVQASFDNASAGGRDCLEESGYYEGAVISVPAG